MKIVYAYEYDASNPATQSTRPFSILRELKRRYEIVECFPLPNISRRLMGFKKLWYLARGCDHHLEREYLALREYAWRVEHRINDINPDIVFSPSQIIPTYLRTKAKIVYCNDAPFSGILNYPVYSNLSREYMHQGYRQEARSHQNATRIVYPSSWAIDLAVREHGADRSKCLEQAFGANLLLEPCWDEVREAITRRIARREVSIVLVCSDWHRKAGDFAAGIVSSLRLKGVPAKLKVFGRAPQGIEGVEPLGYVNKWTDAGSRQFRDVLLDSNFIIMASIAEAYGMALWEGAAHGLPMLGRATGGINSIVRDQETGLLFPLGAEPCGVADWILDTINGGRYKEYCTRAYEDYRDRGNWRTFVDKVFSI